jgi:RNA polymerase sigma-70 factor (ECF subfamily)
MPQEPEAKGLLALLLLIDGRRGGRVDDAGLVLVEDQDRRRWDHELIAEGEALLVDALGRGRPGLHQLHAAIAACHATAAHAEDTDWHQIGLLYAELLLRCEPTAVVEANRAVAVAMAEGPAAGLVILDAVALHPQLQRWPQLHIARAELLRRAGRDTDAVASYRTALELEPEPAAAVRQHVLRRVSQLGEQEAPRWP